MTNFIRRFSLGMFFILPCIDSYQKVDLRVVSFDVPPQEVQFASFLCIARKMAMAMKML